MKAQAYTAFSQALHTQAQARRLPVNAMIEVTRRCPLTCAHCYNNLPMHDRAARHEELSDEEHCRILDELAEAGCLWLCFTGGEIFAREDFLKIYRHAKQCGFLITLFTNGTLITERIADELVQWRPFAIEITLYGHTRATYERLTGIPGSYDKCLRGIRLLLARGLPLSLKTVGTTLNQHEIYDMKNFARELGLGFRFDSLINPRVDCSRSPLAVRLPPAEIVALDLQDPLRVAEYQDLIRRSSDIEPSPAQQDEVYHCGGGINAFAIDPYGRLSICVLSEVEKYDLRRGSFKQGWEEFLGKVRRKKATRPSKCTACRLKGLCGMCPANGEMEHGDPEQPVDFLCHTTHLRAQVFGAAVPPHGACEYCAGGSRYETLQREAAALRARSDNARQPAVFSRKALPIVNTQTTATEPGCGSSGCTSCRTY